MSLRPFALAALVVAACTSVEPPPEARHDSLIEPASTPVVEDVPQPPPAAALPRSTLPWVWYHTMPAILADGLSQVGVGPVAHDHRVGDPRRYTARRDEQGIELVRERLPDAGERGEPTPVWRQRITTTASIGEPVVQTSMGPPMRVVVALRISDGYELHALDEAGVERFTLVALDPLGFDAAGAQLQLGGTSDRVLVYVRGRAQAHLDEIDPTRGQRVARGSFDDNVLLQRAIWPPEGPEGLALGHRWSSKHGSYVVVERKEALELHANDPVGKLRWRTTLEPKGRRWSNAAAVLEHDDRVIVVAYGNGSSGATAFVLDRVDGKLRYTGSPGSIGSIGHSKYGNEVGLEIDDEGHVLVHGHESGGDYVGVLDVQAGRLLGHEVWRR